VGLAIAEPLRRCTFTQLRGQMPTNHRSLVAYQSSEPRGTRVCPTEPTSASGAGTLGGERSSVERPPLSRSSDSLPTPDSDRTSRPCRVCELEHVLDNVLQPTSRSRRVFATFTSQPAYGADADRFRDNRTTEHGQARLLRIAARHGRRSTGSPVVTRCRSSSLLSNPGTCRILVERFRKVLLAEVSAR
jgi:hypothetical protein